MNNKFYKLFIRNVPPGFVLNKDTADNFELIFSDSYANKNGWTLNKMDNKEYLLRPPTFDKDGNISKYHGIYKRGTLRYCLKEFYKIIENEG
mgnify:CR=1 FL=1